MNRRRSGQTAPGTRFAAAGVVVAAVALAIVAVAVTGAACSGSGDPPCFVGDPALEPELEVVYRTAAGDIAELAAGGTVPMFQPLQGGQVMFVGAQARNVDCELDIEARLSDPCTGQDLSVERRSVRLVQRDDGWGVPDLSNPLANFAHLLACPIPDAQRDIDDEPYRLRVRIEDPGGRVAEREIDVVPVCGEPAREQPCKCNCNSVYIPEAECTPEIDGGPPPGTCLADAGVSGPPAAANPTPAR